MIVSYPDIAIDFLPAALSDFLKERPDVRVHLQARRSEMMTGLLQTNDFDLAISTRLAETHKHDIQEFVIPCLVAFPRGQAPKGHLALEPSDIQSEPLICVSANHPCTVQLTERFDQRSVSYPGAAIETQTFESVCGFVRRGFGVGLIDALTAQRYKNELDVLRFVPEVWQTIYSVGPLDRPASKITMAFTESLAEKFKSLVI